VVIIATIDLDITETNLFCIGYNRVPKNPNSWVLKNRKGKVVATAECLYKNHYRITKKGLFLGYMRHNTDFRAKYSHMISPNAIK